jgi:hypothetical protein
MFVCKRSLVIVTSEQACAGSRDRVRLRLPKGVSNYGPLLAHCVRLRCFHCVRALIDERPVPDPHGRYVAIVAEDTERARIQQEVLATTYG